MKKKRCYLLVLAVMCSIPCTRAYSEVPRWTRIAGNPTITSMTEDDEFYWIGTDIGLCRMHKIEGTVEIYDCSNSSIPSDHINHLAVHPHTNDLWIATGGGVCRFDRQTFTVPESAPSDGRVNCRSLSIDSSGGIWIALKRGEYPGVVALGRIDTEGNYTDVLMNTPGFPGGLLHSRFVEMHADKFGGIWIRSLDTVNDVMTYLRNDRWHTFNVPMRYSTLDNNGRLWFIGGRNFFGPQNGLAYIPNGGDVVWIDSSTVPFDPQNVRRIAGLPGGNEILVSDNASYYRYRDGEWVESGIETRDEYRLFYPAENGTMWWLPWDGRKGQLITRVDSISREIVRPFGTYVGAFVDITCTAKGRIGAIARRSGVEHLVCCSSGVFHSVGTLHGAKSIVSGGTDSFYLGAGYPRVRLGIYTDIFSVHDFGMSSRAVGAVGVDAGGIPTFLTNAGTWLSYLHRFDPIAQKELERIQVTASISHNDDVVFDKGNLLWGCWSEGGLISVNIDGGRWTAREFLDTHPYADATCRGLVLDSLGCFWSASDSAQVIKFSPEGNVQKVYRLSTGQTSRTHVHCASRDGGVWLTLRQDFGSPTRACRIRNDSVKVFNSRKDPAMSRVEGATADTSGNIWFCTERAVVVFNPEGITDRPALPVRKEASRGPQSGENPFSFRILRADKMSALRVNLPKPARLEYTIFDSRGRTVTAREAVRLPVGEHQLPIGRNLVGRSADAVLFVRVRVIPMHGESTTHVARYILSSTPARSR